MRMGILSKPITWLSLALLAALVLLALIAQRQLLSGRAAASDPTPAAGLSADIVIPPRSLPAPDFSLRDPAGKTVSSAALRGRLLAITFLGSHCKSLCPLEGV